MAGGGALPFGRQLNFGDPAPAAEFVEQRVRWIELLSATANATAPGLVQALALLVQSEQELPTTSAALLARVAGTSGAAEIDDGIAAILVGRNRGRSIQELCATGGITLDDFSQSVAYREIFGRGEAQGEVRGEAKVTLRLLARRCGPLSAEQESLIRSLHPERLEALLDFEGMADLNSWLAASG